MWKLLPQWIFEMGKNNLFAYLCAVNSTQYHQIGPLFSENRKCAPSSINLHVRLMCMCVGKVPWTCSFDRHPKWCATHKILINLLTIYCFQFACATIVLHVLFIWFDVCIVWQTVDWKISFLLFIVGAMCSHSFSLDIPFLWFHLWRSHTFDHTKCIWIHRTDNDEEQNDIKFRIIKCLKMAAVGDSDSDASCNHTTQNTAHKNQSFRRAAFLWNFLVRCESITSQDLHTNAWEGWWMAFRVIKIEIQLKTWRTMNAEDFSCTISNYTFTSRAFVIFKIPEFRFSSIKRIRFGNSHRSNRIDQSSFWDHLTINGYWIRPFSNRSVANSVVFLPFVE